MLQECFDAHLLAPLSPSSRPPCAGAILYGPDAVEVCRRLQEPGERRWYHAAELKAVIGRADSRFPTTGPLLIDLQIPEENISPRLQTPLESWGPLAVSCRGNCILKLNIAAGPAAIAGPKKLLKAYPQTLFLVDAFRHGPEPGWQAHVRLAECENAWLTTLGLFPGPACHWRRPEDVATALHFVLGEVGAGKLLFASGRRWEDFEEAGEAAPAPSAWLASLATLNDPERGLIGWENARDIIGRF